MSGQPTSDNALRVADLPADRAHTFQIEPDTQARGALASVLGLRGLRKLRFAGTLSPVGQDDWELCAHLGATVVQDCVVTLDPVTTRIDEDIRRRYLLDMPELPESDEVEMPEDDTLEPLPIVLDLDEVMQEALTLALPTFPRAKGAEMKSVQVTAPGAKPLLEEDTKPFANLKDLLDKS